MIDRPREFRMHGSGLRRRLRSGCESCAQVRRRSYFSILIHIHILYSLVQRKVQLLLALSYRLSLL